MAEHRGSILVGGDEPRTAQLLAEYKDLGDIGGDGHRQLEASVANARRSVGLS